MITNKALQQLNKIAENLEFMHLPEMDEKEVKGYAKNIRKQIQVIGLENGIGHICSDGSYCMHSQKSCLSCGGWDGMKGRH